MKQIQIFAVTFPSFTVNCNDVCGIGSHPLPHTCCIFQHVPETDSPAQLQRHYSIRNATLWYILFVHVFMIVYRNASS